MYNNASGLHISGKPSNVQQYEQLRLHISCKTSNVQQYEQLRLHVSGKPSNVQQDESLKTTQLGKAIKLIGIATRMNVRTCDYRSMRPALHWFQNGNSILVWSTRQWVLLACLILRISTKIPKGTWGEASDQCMCFSSFLRVLGASNKGRKEERRRKICRFQIWVSGISCMYVDYISDIRFEFWDGYYSSFIPWMCLKSKITLLIPT